MSQHSRSDVFRFAPSRERPSARSIFFMSIAALMYASSLVLPTMYDCGGARLPVIDYHAACGSTPELSGLGALLLGSIGLLVVGIDTARGDFSWTQNVDTIREQLAYFGVLANVGVALTVLALLRKRRPLPVFACASLGLALLSHARMRSYYRFGGLAVMSVDGPGYWVWVAAIVLMLAGTILYRAPGQPSRLAQETERP